MTFLDTNILVYAVDNRDARKQSIAQLIVEAALERQGDYAIAVQTLSEFANVALTKLKKTPDEVHELLDVYVQIPTVSPDGAIVTRGVEIKRTYRLQFYDSMMLAAAERAGAEVILTEDLNDGQVYAGVQAKNPFALTK